MTKMYDVNIVLLTNKHDHYVYLNVYTPNFVFTLKVMKQRLYLYQ